MAGGSPPPVPALSRSPCSLEPHPRAHLIPEPSRWSQSHQGEDPQSLSALPRPAGPSASTAVAASLSLCSLVLRGRLWAALSSTCCLVESQSCSHADILLSLQG